MKVTADQHQLLITETHLPTSIFADVDAAEKFTSSARIGGSLRQRGLNLWVILVVDDIVHRVTLNEKILLNSRKRMIG